MFFVWFIVEAAVLLEALKSKPIEQSAVRGRKHSKSAGFGKCKVCEAEDLICHSH